MSFWQGVKSGWSGVSPYKKLAIPRKRKYNQFGVRMMKRIKNLESGKTGKEWKYHDKTITDNIENTGTVVVLTSMADGTTEIEREGNQVRLQSIDVNIYLSSNTNDNTKNLNRLIIFYDYQNETGVLPAITDVLEAATYDALKNKDNQERFVIIMDRKIQLGADINAAVVHKYIKMFKKLGGRIAHFDGSAAADHQKGHLFILYIGTKETSNFPIIKVSSRLRFTE